MRVHKDDMHVLSASCRALCAVAAGDGTCVQAVLGTGSVRAMVEAMTSFGVPMGIGQEKTHTL